MPAKRLRLTCRHVFTLIALVLVLPAAAKAQTGRATLQATVSETVALSVLPNFSRGDVNADVVSNGNTVRIILSSTGVKDAVIRVPLLVRSNSNFKLSASVDPAGVITQLSVLDVRATGKLVSLQAVNGLNVPQQFDRRGRDENTFSSLDLSQPLLVLSGPRVSLGGTLNSPNNALQITVLIRLPPQHASPLHLTFAATAGPPIQ